MYAYLVGAIAFLLAVIGAGWEGYSLGADHTKATYAARDLQTANETAAQIKGITTRNRATENEWAQAFGQADLKLTQELQTHAKTKEDLRAALRRGAVVLRDPGTNNQACGDSAAATPASAGSSNGSQGRELSPELAEFLTSEAGRADEVALQLTACQALLESERR